jgi:hypothetical protein
VDELFHYVNQRVRKRELSTPQIPVISADKVNSRVDLARCYVGPPLSPVAIPTHRNQPHPFTNTSCW